MKITKQIERYVLPKIVSKKCVFCVTGPMAAGKNYVCDELKKMGFVSIDLDKEVHQVIEEKNEEILKTFETIAKERDIKIRTSENKVDRRALGTLLFSDERLLKKHEELIYPALTEKVLTFIKNTNERKDSRPRGIILNATVLYKTPALLKKCDFVVYVHANWIKRFNRARKRDKMNEIAILQRFTAQKGLLERYKECEKQIVVIKN